MARITFLVLFVVFSANFHTLAQQPGMNPLKPLGVKPHGIGKMKDIDQLKTRTLAVLMEEENALDIVKLNRNLKKAIEEYWKIPVKEIEFRNNYEIQGIIDTKDTNFVILQCPDRVLTITELPEEHVPTTLRVRKLELFLAENRRRIAVVRLPDDIPSLGEMIIAMKQVQKFLQDRKEDKDDKDHRKEIRGNNAQIKGKILLINEADFRDRSEIDLKEIRRLYTDSIAVVNYSVIDSVIVSESSKHAFIQMVHYMRTKSLHFIIDAGDGRFLGYFKTRNALGDYLNYHQHVTVKHIKRYAELSGRSFADIFTKRFALTYCGGFEVGFRYLAMQSWYNGKTYKGKTVFTERIDDNTVVDHVGETEYQKTTSVGYGVSFTSYLDTLLSLQTGFYFSPQGQRFIFTHFDSLQNTSRKREIYWKLTYYKIPLLLNINTNNNSELVLNAFAGPQIGILQEAEEYIDGTVFQTDAEEIEGQRSFKEKSDYATFKSSFKSIDIGLVLGGGMDVKVWNNIFAHAAIRFDTSLLDADDRQWKLDDKTARNMTLAIQFGLNFIY